MRQNISNILFGVIYIVSMSVLVPTTCRSDDICTLEKHHPEMYETDEKARMMSCNIVALKSSVQENCVVQQFDDHELHIAIYDRDANGSFIKSTEFCVPSWYNFAQVDYVDILGDGRNFFDITFEGNTGTGTLQTIEMFVGWDGNRFVPVFAETISYYISDLGYKRELTVKPFITKSKNASVLLKVIYKEELLDDDLSEQQRYNVEWQTALKWNDSHFIFQEDSSLWESSSSLQMIPTWLQKNMSLARESIGNLTINDLCDNYLEKSKVMDILEEQSQIEP